MCVGATKKSPRGVRHRRVSFANCWYMPTLVKTDTLVLEASNGGKEIERAVAQTGRCVLKVLAKRDPLAVGDTLRFEASD